MIGWLDSRTAGELVWLTVAVVLVLVVVSAVLGRVLVRRGLRAPFVVRRINEAREWAIDLVKRPITIAVLDEVADVIVTGHYTKNISSALLENHDELLELVAEKVRDDPAARVVSRLPGYDLVVSQASESTLRVIIEMLGDPRMDELVSDLLRNNLEQIKVAVRERQHEEVVAHTRPDRRRHRHGGSPSTPTSSTPPPRRNPPGPGA